MRYWVNFERRCDDDTASVKLSEIKELLMKDEEFKTEYDKLEPHYDVVSIFIKQPLPVKNR